MWGVRGRVWARLGLENERGVRLPRASFRTFSFAAVVQWRSASPFSHAPFPMLRRAAAALAARSARLASASEAQVRDRGERARARVCAARQQHPDPNGAGPAPLSPSSRCPRPHANSPLSNHTQAARGVSSSAQAWAAKEVREGEGGERHAYLLPVDAAAARSNRPPSCPLSLSPPFFFPSGPRRALHPGHPGPVCDRPVRGVEEGGRPGRCRQGPGAGERGERRESGGAAASRALSHNSHTLTLFPLPRSAPSPPPPPPSPPSSRTGPSPRRPRVPSWSPSCPT